MIAGEYTAPPAQGPPRAAREAEVKHDDGIGGGQPGGQARVVGAKVAVDDPPLPRDQLAVPDHPQLGRGRLRPRLPEQAVKLDRGDASQPAELTGEHGLAGSAPPQDDYSPHPLIVPAQRHAQAHFGRSAQYRILSVVTL